MLRWSMGSLLVSGMFIPAAWGEMSGFASSLDAWEVSKIVGEIISTMLARVDVEDDGLRGGYGLRVSESAVEGDSLPASVMSMSTCLFTWMRKVLGSLMPHCT